MTFWPVNRGVFGEKYGCCQKLKRKLNKGKKTERQEKEKKSKIDDNDKTGEKNKRVLCVQDGMCEGWTGIKRPGRVGKRNRFLLLQVPPSPYLPIYLPVPFRAKYFFRQGGKRRETQFPCPLGAWRCGERASRGSSWLAHKVHSSLLNFGRKTGKPGIPPRN